MYVLWFTSKWKQKEIETRVINYLINSSKALIIQRAWRKKLWSIVHKLIGPAAYNRSLCVNTTDFFTRQPLIDIEWNQFISLKDIEENKIYGFDIMSLYHGIIFILIGIGFAIPGIMTLRNLKLYFNPFYNEFKCYLYVSVLGLTVPELMRGILNFLIF